MIDLSRLPDEGLRERGTTARLELESPGKAEAIEALTGQPEAFTDITWSVFAQPSDHDVFLDVSGKGTWETSCSRCLAPIEVPLDVRAQFLGSREAELRQGGSHSLGSQDLDLVFLESDHIEELELVRQQLMLGRSMAPTCLDTKKGKCANFDTCLFRGTLNASVSYEKEPSPLAKALANIRPSLKLDDSSK